jgi:hypothetical protein
MPRLAVMPLLSPDAKAPMAQATYTTQPSHGLEAATTVQTLLIMV